MVRVLLSAVLVASLSLGPAAPVAAGEFSTLAAGLLAVYSRPRPPSPPTPGPAPSPVPAPDQACANCRGTGRLGDGTISLICPVCKGTGRTPAADPAPLVEQPAGRWETQCSGGSCRQVWVQGGDSSVVPYFRLFRRRN